MMVQRTVLSIYQVPGTKVLQGKATYMAYGEYLVGPTKYQQEDRF